MNGAASRSLRPSRLVDQLAAVLDRVEAPASGRHRYLRGGSLWVYPVARHAMRISLSLDGEPLPIAGWSISRTGPSRWSSFSGRRGGICGGAIGSRSRHVPIASAALRDVRQRLVRPARPRLRHVGTVARERLDLHAAGAGGADDQLD